MRVWVLGSGSSGNAVLIEDRAARILVDAGFATAELERRLAHAGVAPETITHLVLTHAHGDHVLGAATSGRRWGWTLCATPGTVAECGELNNTVLEIVEVGQCFAVSAFEIETVPTPHDAADSVALVITSVRSGARLGICTDLGHETTAIRTAMRGLDLLLLESNHDPELLRDGPYPLSVKRRIGGDHGHLSNAQAATLARAVAHEGMAHLILGHLSRKCNDPALARRLVGRALLDTTFSGRLHMAEQDRVIGPFSPGAVELDADEQARQTRLAALRARRT